MKVDVKNIDGQTVDEMDLRDEIFGIEPNTAVMHQALVRQQANARLGTHKAKTRGEVRGTTAKWYRQKGTGRARHGDRKAPIFVGGGQAHKPVPRDYTKKMPRKMRRLALRSALSVKAASEEIIVLDTLDFDNPKTAQMLELLDNLKVEGSAVILLPERNENVEKSARNLKDVKTLHANYLNIKDLLGSDYIIIPKSALSTIESFLV
ncbi:MAG TPA: 50S ribosomal protein L4 [Anaerolineae bacterium]|nr:50S ribosomal protein L4 [Anaerolineae bacterium]MCB0225710.1 50S ribosomal protein L4 [Anaerolineae bacterium]MCB9103184.1 50S ribosomal protein L4 [Anaerolineales bacterium]HRV95621.1 50S ribosomal protein L4 [Anaerolineae bacterium]